MGGQKWTTTFDQVLTSPAKLTSSSNLLLLQNEVFIFLIIIFIHFITPLGKFRPPYLGDYSSHKSSATQSFKCMLGLFVFP